MKLFLLLLLSGKYHTAVNFDRNKRFVCLKKIWMFFFIEPLKMPLSISFLWEISIYFRKKPEITDCKLNTCAHFLFKKYSSTYSYFSLN